MLPLLHTAKLVESSLAHHWTPNPPLSLTWLTLGTNSDLTYMSVASIIRALQRRGTQMLKEEGSRAIFHPSVIYFSYCICCISLQGSFLIRGGDADLPLTPILIKTQYAIYSPSYNHIWNHHRAFLGVPSSVFCKLLLSWVWHIQRKILPMSWRTTSMLYWRHCITTPTNAGDVQCPRCAWLEISSTWLEKAYEQ